MNRNGNGSNGIWEDWVVVSPPKVDFGEISINKNEERSFECSVKIQNIRSHGIKLNFQERISGDSDPRTSKGDGTGAEVLARSLIKTSKSL